MKRLLVVMWLAAMAVMLQGGVADSRAASAVVNGLATVDWAQATFSRTDLNWFDNTTVPPTDLRNSFSGAFTRLNGVEDHSVFGDGVEGGWVSTMYTSTLTDGIGTVTGVGKTGPVPSYDPGGPQPASQLSGSASIVLNGLGNASVEIAQGVLSGLFTVPTDGLLTIMAPYHLERQLSVTGGLTASVNVQAGLSLFEYDVWGNIVGTKTDTQILAAALLDEGTLALLQKDGWLSLTYALTAGTFYEFEAQASASAMAPVPIPGAFLLLGSGLTGLAFLRRRFRI